MALGAAHASYLQGIVNSIPDDPSKPDSKVIRYANSPPAVAIGGDVELRREWRRGWMLGAMYGYQRARLIEGTGNTRLVNAPEHLASFRGVVPVVRELASLGLRVRLEAPRRNPPGERRDHQDGRGPRRHRLGDAPRLRAPLRGRRLQRHRLALPRSP